MNTPAPASFVGWHMLVPTGRNESAAVDYVFVAAGPDTWSCDTCDGRSTNPTGAKYEVRSPEDSGVYCHECAATVLWPTSIFVWVHP